ncbi:MAG: HD domain-containing protein [Fimbriimonadales bacterium]
MAKVYEFRCPVHGFIEVDEWEREIIAHPVFQRLRRIRQLGFTDYIYPGAMHTRFEHSLGVMHIATKLYDAITQRSSEVLKEYLGYNEDGLRRDRRLVRLAALLHDVGHGPFSHVSEELLPFRDEEQKERYRHEDYSVALVRHLLREVIENHPMNENYGIKAEDVAAFLEGSVKVRKLLFWRELITSQMDADRMDYLLRDSLHLGVRYGTYDLERVVNTVCLVPSIEEVNESITTRIGVTEGGWHAVESLILARYYMFTQVYFHKTRVAYDHHIGQVMRHLLPSGNFPKPETDELEAYLCWDDWKVLGKIAEEQAGEHGKRIRKRNHFRMVYATPEVPNAEDLERLEANKERLGDLLVYEGASEKSWYNIPKDEIPVLMDNGKIRVLSELSCPIRNMERINQILLYVKPEDADIARKRLEGTA